MKTKRQTIDPMLTMINVVFLLIAFFLFGQLTPAPPVSIELPIAMSSQERAVEDAIFVDATTTVFYREFSGENAIIEAAKANAVFVLYADKSIPINRLIIIWKKLLLSGIEIQNVGVAE